MYVSEDRDEVTVVPEDMTGWYAQVTEGRVHMSGPGERQCNGEPGGERWRCADCGERLRYNDSPDTERWATEDGDDFCQSMSADEEDRHEPEPIPLSWANSAWVDLDESRDEITVGISVGDPRGAFVLRIERMRWEDEDGQHDELRLSVPHPEQGLLHMPLTDLASRGYYKIGN